MRIRNRQQSCCLAFIANPRIYMVRSVIPSRGPGVGGAAISAAVGCDGGRHIGGRPRYIGDFVRPPVRRDQSGESGNRRICDSNESRIPPDSRRR